MGCGEGREGVECWRRVRERVDHWMGVESLSREGYEEGGALEG